VALQAPTDHAEGGPEIELACVCINAEMSVIWAGQGKVRHLSPRLLLLPDQHRQRQWLIGGDDWAALQTEPLRRRTVRGDPASRCARPPRSLSAPFPRWCAPRR
jgi:hypothetical protein